MAYGVRPDAHRPHPHARCHEFFPHWHAKLTLPRCTWAVVKILLKMSTLWVGHNNVTDRTTADKRTAEAIKRT